jgi:hypothetical protein
VNDQKRIIELLEMLVGQEGYAPRLEPAANYGRQMWANEFPPLNANLETSFQFVELIFQQDRTFFVEWQANDLDTKVFDKSLPYGLVVVEYVRGGSRHVRTFDLTNRLGRILLTGREMRVTVVLSGFNLGTTAASLQVDVSAGEAHAGTREDAPLDPFAFQFAAAPVQLGLEGVIREMALYCNGVGLWLMLFASSVQPVTATNTLPTYLFGNGTDDTVVIPGIAWEMGQNMWWALSTSPLSYTAPGDGALATCVFSFEYGNGLP